MTGFEDIITEWRKAGIIPPEGTPLPPKVEVDPAVEIEQQRLSKWREYCPVEFQKKIDRSLLPDLRAWDEADKWDGSYPGLWLWSYDTGLGKTRMLWRKFCQMHVRKGKTVMRITGVNLAEEYHDAYNKSQTSRFYREVMGFDIVMLDDLDKMPLPNVGQGFSAQDQAGRNARMLRQLFDNFYEEHTVVLGTANEPIEWFEERIGKSGSRRIRECCRVIEFKRC